MTYIMLDADNKLVVTKMDSIYRGENLSKKITFLIPKMIGDVAVSETTVFLSYIRADGTADIAVLIPSSELYNSEYYQYVIPVTCRLSRFPGNVRMWLQFYSGSVNCPDTIKSGDCVIHILNSDNIDHCLDDHVLTALYQLKVKLDNIDEGSSGPNDDKEPDSGEDPDPDPGEDPDDGSGNGSGSNDDGPQDGNDDEDEDEDDYPVVEF